MLLLALDTATPAVTVALHDGTDVLASAGQVDARRHGELLLPAVDRLLAAAGQRLDAVTGIVVGVGPGPYTGLRVGLMTADTFGLALGVPVHGVCTLDAIGIETTGEVLVVTDARRREVYWARYRDGVRVDGPAVNAPADVLAAADVLAGPPRYPTPAGLVRAVADWSAEPAPLVPLYLRRPDAKPSVAIR